jgi:hypothetical protein
MATPCAISANLAAGHDRGAAAVSQQSSDITARRAGKAQTDVAIMLPLPRRGSAATCDPVHADAALVVGCGSGRRWRSLPSLLRSGAYLAHEALVPSTGALRAPGRHRLTSPATRVTRKIWPVSISNTAKDWPTVPAGIRLPYPVVVRVV